MGAGRDGVLFGAGEVRRAFRLEPTQKVRLQAKVSASHNRYHYFFGLRLPPRPVLLRIFPSDHSTEMEKVLSYIEPS